MLRDTEMISYIEHNFDTAELMETGRFVRTTAVGSTKVGDTAGTSDKLGYVRIAINKKLIYAHRLAYLYYHGSFPKNDIDHINGVTNDNRKVNLRDVTESVNLKNTKIRTCNTSGHTGLSFNTAMKRWVSRVTINKKRKAKVFVDKKEAVVWLEEKQSQNGYTLRSARGIA